MMETYTLQQNQLLLQRRKALTESLLTLPYDLILYLDRAVVHSDLGYPDLAAGDAYRALLLVDEARDPSFEYHSQALESLQRYIIDVLRSDVQESGIEEREWSPESRSLPPVLQGHGSLEPAMDPSEDVDPEDIPACQLASRAAIRAYQILSLSLLLCGCLKSAYDFCLRGIEAASDEAQEELFQTKEYIIKLARRRLKTEDFDIDDLPDQGLVRREIYPWNDLEPDRYAEETIEELNQELRKVAPKAEVRVTELPVLGEERNNPSSGSHDGTIPDHPTEETNPQLGLFATEDIYPGEVVLDEYSLLTASNRLHDTLCDACCAPLPALNDSSPAVACEDCADTLFCSDFCHDAAMASYHPALCGKDIDDVARDTDREAVDVNAIDALYLLLLTRTFAMSLTQSINPLRLQSVKSLWGDFLPSANNAVPLSPLADPPPVWTLPFSFAANVSGPLHVLERMEVDIYAELDWCDLWVVNTLLARFRGVASARVEGEDESSGIGAPGARAAKKQKVGGRRGGVEVAAIHPLWCLANHSCEPGVTWRWGGRMKLIAREVESDFESPISPHPDNGSAPPPLKPRTPRIREAEEIFNHYCDIDLPVQERREWAKGSLGGWCMCPRCKREAAAAGEKE